MKSLLIHVGADQSDWTTLGVNAPIFADGSFEFLPILESTTDGEYILETAGRYVRVQNGKKSKKKPWTSETRTYSRIRTRNEKFGKYLSEYVPKGCEHFVVHLDPDFEHYTYGDRADTPRGMQIRLLEKGDYLFFVESLAPYAKDAYSVRNRAAIRFHQKGKMAKFVIGYFKIQSIFHVEVGHNSRILVDPIIRNLESRNRPEIHKRALGRIEENVHTKRDQDEFFVAVGERYKSLFLQKAVKLTKSGSPFRPNRIGKEIFGNLSYPRGVKWINDDSRIRTLLNYCHLRI